MRIRGCPNRFACWGYDEGTCDECDIGKIITKFQKRIKNLKKKNETLTIQKNDWEQLARFYEAHEPNKWISVEDRLPDIDELCLLSMENRITKYKWVVIGYYHTNYDEYVTHWMPLPELPKESEDTE